MTAAFPIWWSWNWRKASRQRDVVPLTGRARPVRARRDARDVAEVVDEMGLVAVAVVGGHRGPVDGPRRVQRVDGGDHPLDPADPGEQLGGQPSPVTEAPGEPLREQPEIVADIADQAAAFQRR